MTKNVRIWIDCALEDDADITAVADRVADLVGNDPDDICPEIITTDDWGAELFP